MTGRIQKFRYYQLLNKDNPDTNQADPSGYIHEHPLFLLQTGTSDDQVYPFIPVINFQVQISYCCIFIG